MNANQLGGSTPDLFQFSGGVINGCRIVLQYFGDTCDFLFRLRVTLFFDGFSNSRQGLGCIAGVVAGSINQVLVPRTAQEPIGICELAFSLKKLNIQNLKGLLRRGGPTFREGLDGL